MVLHFNPVVIETFARIEAARAFVEMVNDGVPVIAAKEHECLENLAADGNWEYGEYAVERDILNRKFDAWIPTVAAYSATVFIHSIVETQLDALAEQLGKKRGARLQVGDIHGRGIERSATFLERVLAIEVKSDSEWNRLQDLQSLRNLIVHRGGKRAWGRRSEEGREDHSEVSTIA